MSDHNLISTESHELNYLLSKFGYRETEANREIMKNIIEAFKTIDSIKPHNRENFYKYFDSAGSFINKCLLEK